MDYEVAIVGAGFSGIGAAIGLQRDGVEDLVLLEDGDGVGGAWHWNTYPGVAVDIPSFSYQFSYAMRSSWSRTYAPGRELKAYAEELVDEHGLRPKLRLNTRVVGATFDEAADRWRLRTGDGGELSARHVIGATGALTQPQLPAIPGLGDFAGDTMHTARWDSAVPLKGRRVAVIGTGASAVQLIPSIAPDVAHLTVFQRTPIWCLPKADLPIRGAVRWALDKVPGGKLAARLVSQAYVELTFPIAAHFHGTVPLSKVGERVAKKHLADSVDDPATRAKLQPHYALGCKRPSFSNDYLPTFNREDVALETSPIVRVTPDGIETADGAHHPIDVLVLATGFKVFEAGNMPPYPVAGRDGVDLSDWWGEHRYQAYEGVSVPGFPNLFTVLGPYGYNGSSYFTLIEAQTRHVVRCLREARRRNATRVEVTPAANTAYWKAMLARRHRQVFFQPSCADARSYYFDEHGDVPFRPATTMEAAWRAGHFPLSDYAFA